MLIINMTLKSTTTMKFILTMRTLMNYKMPRLCIRLAIYVPKLVDKQSCFSTFELAKNFEFRGILNEREKNENKRNEVSAREKDSNLGLAYFQVNVK